MTHHSSTDSPAEVPSLIQRVSQRLFGASLRGQLTAWNVAALTLMLAIQAVAIRITVHAFLMGSIDRQLQRQATSLPEMPPPGPGNSKLSGPGDTNRRGLGDRNPGSKGPGDKGPGSGGPGGPEPIRDAPPSDFTGLPPPQDSPDPLAPRHFDLSGRMFGVRPMLDQAGFERARQGEQNFSRLIIGGEPVRVFSVPLRRGGVIVGVGQSGYPLASVERAMAGVDIALLILLPVALLGAGIGGAYLTGRVLQRVGRVAHAATDISSRGAEALSERLPVVGSDEFAELAGTFNTLLDRLETDFNLKDRVLEQQRRFTADASHELKTPLTVIKGTASLSLAGLGSKEEDLRAFRAIDQAADSMSHLVQDLLLLARSDGGQLGLNRIEVPVLELLQRAASGLGERRREISLAVDDPALTVYGNENEFVRLFSNLLDNAVRYTPPPGTVRVTASTDSTSAIIKIIDTGIGIAPEHLPHLGERFYRVDRSRNRSGGEAGGGTGLGLSICQTIVQAHGGDLSIESALGQGTTVTVRLPSEAPDSMSSVL